MKIKEFKDEIFNHIMELFPGSRFYHLTASDHKVIQQLVKNKYSTWEWNYGYSPDYMLKNRFELSGHKINITFRVKKGLIVEAELSGDIFREPSVKKLESILLQQRHEEETLKQIINQSDLKNILNPADEMNLMKCFF
jgi:lipoate-protein ligase A